MYVVLSIITPWKKAVPLEDENIGSYHRFSRPFQAPGPTLEEKVR